VDEQLVMELKRKLSLYRYCLDEWAQYQTELSSLLRYQADAEELVWHLLAQGDEVAGFRNQLHQLNLEKMHHLEYEEALHLWVSLEAAGRILTELERVDGQATHRAEWAHYEALRRELARRLEALPEDTETVRIRTEGWSAPLPQKAVAEEGEPYTHGPD